MVRGMQDCFREHPDVYAAELEDENEPPSEGAPGSEDKELHDIGDQKVSDADKKPNPGDKEPSQPPAPLERPADS